MRNVWIELVWGMFMRKMKWKSFLEVILEESLLNVWCVFIRIIDVVEWHVVIVGMMVFYTRCV